MNIPKLDNSDKRISRLDYNRMASAAQESSNAVFIGGDSDDSCGNSVSTMVPDPELGFWARITDYCRDSMSLPLMDGNGNILYQWIENTRDTDGSGNLIWRDKEPTIESCRQSVLISTGVYRNAAREISTTAPASSKQSSCFAQPNQIVWMYPGFLQFDSNACADHEQLFITYQDGFAIAQSDWVEGTWRTSTGGTDDHVVCKRCIDMDGNVPFGPSFNIYFHKRNGNYDPAIFAAFTNDVGSYAADVITFRWDYVLEQFFCTSPDAYDDALLTVKSFYGSPGNVNNGWHCCDGTTPAGNKIGVALPDTRGLFTRATDKPSSGHLWSDTGGGAAEDYVGPADNTGGDAGAASWGVGGRAGVSSSHKEWGSDTPPATAKWITQTLSDVESWAGPAPADGSPQLDAAGNPINAVVCPPTYVLCQIIRYK